MCPVFLVVVFSFLSAYLHVCVLWAMLPELNKIKCNEMKCFVDRVFDIFPEPEIDACYKLVFL